MKLIHLSAVIYLWIACSAVAAPQLKAAAAARLQTEVAAILTHTQRLDGNTIELRRALARIETAMSTIDQALDGYFHGQNLLDARTRQTVMQMRPVVSRALAQPLLFGAVSVLRSHHEGLHFHPRLHVLMALKYTQLKLPKAASRHYAAALAAGADVQEILPRFIETERALGRLKSVASLRKLQAMNLGPNQKP